MTHVLFIGAGRFQLRTLEAARARGYRISALDGDAAAPGLALADEFAVIDIRDAKACLDFARGRRIDAVLSPAADAGVMTAAVIAEALNLPGPSLDAARRATDKPAMRAAFAAAGLPSAPSRLCRTGESASAAAREFGPKVVVKPAQGSGSRGVALCSEPAQAKAAFAAAAALSPDGGVLVEGFIEGPESAVEGVMSGGRFFPLLASDKQRSAPPALLDLRINFPRDDADGQTQGLFALAEAAARACGIEDAPVHCEIIRSPDGPRLVEIAARGAGFHVFDTIVPAVTGLNAAALQLDLALGERPIPAPHLAAHAILDFPEIAPGRVTAVGDLEALLTDPTVLFAERYVEPGGIVRPLRAGADRAAALGVAAATRSAAESALKRARDALAIVTQPEQEARIA